MNARTVFFAVVSIASGTGIPSVLYAQPAAERLTAPVAESRIRSLSPGDRSALAIAPLARRFSLDPRSVQEGSVKAVIKGNAEVLTAGNIDRKVSEGAVFIQRLGGDATATSIPQSLQTQAISMPKDRALQLSYRFTARAADAASTVVRLKAIVIQGTGLLYDVSRRAYAGTFAIALSNEVDPDDASELAQPIDIIVTAAGASEISPRPLTISQLSRWREVSIAVPGPEGNKFRVAVSADVQDAGNAIDLDVSRPRIQLTAGTSHIIGWGIGKTDITVVAGGLAKPKGYVVTLHSDRGGLSLSSVELDEAGRGVASLRSDSAAGATVEVADEGVSTQGITVSFDPPWLFLIAAVLGGLLGAFVREKGRKNRGRALLIGAASAVIMALAYAVGIDWLASVIPGARIAQAGEAVVFVLGAIAALVGVSALVPVQAKAGS